MASIEIDIDEHLEEATDWCLAAVLRSRGFVVRDKREQLDDKAKRLQLSEMLQAGLAGRLELDAIRSALADRAGWHLVDAFEAALRGDMTLATAHIDREFEPTAAAAER